LLTKELKIINKDTATIFEVQRAVDEKFKVVLNKRYFWALKNEIHSNVGGFHGNLLHGNFEVLIKDLLNCQGQFNSGLKEGEWKYWNAKGYYTKIVQYKQGFKHGTEKLFYNNGNVKATYEFENNLKQGEYVLYNESVELIEKGKFKNGLKHGKIELVNKNSVSIERYKAGIKKEAKQRNKSTEKIKEKKSRPKKEKVVKEGKVKEKGNKDSNETALKERIRKLKEKLKKNDN
jgi:hypothetical protein